MLRSRRERSRGRTIALVLGLAICALGSFSLVSTAIADSIYMKTGTVIRTDKATIEGEAVVFEQFGSRVAIPLSLVERVVPDDHTGPVAVTRETPTAGSGTGRSTAGGAGSVSTQAASAASAPPDQPVPPEETKEYWQNRVRALYQQGDQLENQLKEARRVEQAFLFSRRSTADSRRRVEDIQSAIDANEQAKKDIQREARRKNIPPGWLRVRGVTY